MPERVKVVIATSCAETGLSCCIILNPGNEIGSGAASPSFNFGRPADRRGVAQLAPLRSPLRSDEAPNLTSSHLTEACDDFDPSRRALDPARALGVAPSAPEHVSAISFRQFSENCRNGFGPRPPWTRPAERHSGARSKARRLGIACRATPTRFRDMGNAVATTDAHRFSAFWLRSSVVSVLFRLIPETRIIDPLCVLI